SLVPLDPISRLTLNRGSPEEEYPDLKRNRTVMASVLTLSMYKRQYNRATDSGVIFDDATGPAAVGCLAGDAQSYILFCSFFDRVIEAHQGYNMSGSQESDFNYDNLKREALLHDRSSCVYVLISTRFQGGDDFDSAYTQGCEVRSILGDAVTMETATDPRMKTGVARDWPDSRAAWVSKDGNLVVWVNVDDHLQLVSARTDSNIRKAFESVCVHLKKLEALYRKLRHSFIWKQHLGWVVSSPADVGTGLRASVWLKLCHLPLHKRLGNILERLRLHMDTADCSGVYRVSNAQTIGFTEVELLQLLVDGVKLLTVMERALEQPDGSIDHLVPAQK
ncbi:hypothetical protein JZ751_006346, partial [Albula glossodonta]